MRNVFQLFKRKFIEMTTKIEETDNQELITERDRLLNEIKEANHYLNEVEEKQVLAFSELQSRLNDLAKGRKDLQNDRVAFQALKENFKQETKKLVFSDLQNSFNDLAKEKEDLQNDRVAFQASKKKLEQETEELEKEKEKLVQKDGYISYADFLEKKEFLTRKKQRLREHQREFTKEIAKNNKVKNELDELKHRLIRNQSACNMKESFLQSKETELNMKQKILDEKTETFEKGSRRVSTLKNSDLVKLNVGGKIFETMCETLLNPSDPSPFFEAWFSERWSGSIGTKEEVRFLDRDPEAFELYLSCLRNGLEYVKTLTTIQIMKVFFEAQYFGNEKLEKMTTKISESFPLRNVSYPLKYRPTRAFI